ncbi:hypothetical protein AAMO2058_001236800 [Amorphochlora amoebiformis]
MPKKSKITQKTPTQSSIPLSWIRDITSNTCDTAVSHDGNRTRESDMGWCHGLWGEEGEENIDRVLRKGVGFDEESVDGGWDEVRHAVVTDIDASAIEKRRCEKISRFFTGFKAWGMSHHDVQKIIRNSGCTHVLDLFRRMAVEKSFERAFLRYIENPALRGRGLRYRKQIRTMIIDEINWFQTHSFIRLPPISHSPHREGEDTEDTPFVPCHLTLPANPLPHRTKEPLVD